jgi:hypothetical protein
MDMAGAGVICPAPATPPGSGERASMREHRSGERAIMEADVSRPDHMGVAARPAWMVVGVTAAPAFGREKDKARAIIFAARHRHPKS